MVELERELHDHVEFDRIVSTLGEFKMKISRADVAKKIVYFNHIKIPSLKSLEGELSVETSEKRTIVKVNIHDTRVSKLTNILAVPAFAILAAINAVWYQSIYIPVLAFLLATSLHLIYLRELGKRKRRFANSILDVVARATQHQ